MKNGKFIVIEGGEGSGKDTQIEFLRGALKDLEVIFTREPGGTELGKHIREIVQDKTLDISEDADLMLYSADRAEHMREVVAPALKCGKHVISNRFNLSTIAYQLCGRERLYLFDFFRTLDKHIIGEFSPDLYILLDCDPEIGLERTQARGDSATRFESKDLEFHKRVRDGFLKYLPNSPRGIVIDGGRTAEEVRSDVLAVVLACFDA
jgi:dTMP kinase